MPAPASNRLALTLIIAGVVASPARAADPWTAPRLPEPWTPLKIRQVQVGGEIGRRIDVTIQNNLLKIDLERDFLAPFRQRDAKSGYIGLGKLIDATVRFAAYSNDPRVLAAKKQLVEATLATQEADGYIGMLAPDQRMRGLWDIHEMGYIILGLVADHDFFRNEAALAGARRLADYLLRRWSELPPDWNRRTHIATHVAVTGLERAMLALHAATRDPRYLAFCVKDRGLDSRALEIVVGRRDQILGHSYAYCASSLAQLDLDRLEPRDALLASTRAALRFLTEQDGLTITGGVGQAEIWTRDQDGRGDLGETCSTAYQLRLYDRWLRLHGTPKLGDIMERTIFNALFAAQSPDGRQLRYYAPFEGPRVYHPTDTYCCPCNFRRIIAELPAMVYYQAGRGIVVNLYTASRGRCELPGAGAVVLRQETDYPSSGRVVLTLEPEKPAEFPLMLRIPGWCAHARVSVNGEAVAGPVRRGEFLTLARTWRSGDKVELDLPMPWRLVLGRQQQSGRVAVMRGPVVFCLNPEQSPELARLESRDLTRLVIDGPALEPPVPSDAVRPGGVACRLKAGDKPFAMGNAGNLRLVLQEFPDPLGRSVYFRVPDLRQAEPDELSR